jgi:hypothetical protein
VADDLTDGAGEPASWLLLIHQLPAKPAYFRVKIWRRLQGLGAVLLKNSVYVLPASERTQEDFEWLLKEIGEGGGEGIICEAKLIDGLSDDDVQQLFTAARQADYEAAAKAARALADSLGGKLDHAARADAKLRLTRLKAEIARVFEIDFFDANGREAVAGLVEAIEALLDEDSDMTREGETVGIEHPCLPLPKQHVWVTRLGVFVDRIASAWLIRRFIDAKARFKFVPAKGYVPTAGEVRFDMFEAEFTHEGDHCTFEVLLARSGLSDRALAAIAQIVHDIDMKDSKFEREETRGIASLIEGISASTKDDEQRLERGAAVFDDLYAYFGKKRR